MFSAKSYEERFITRDSGVWMEVTTTFRASSKDKNLQDQSTKYYGGEQDPLVQTLTRFKPGDGYLNRFKSIDNYYDEPAIMDFEAKLVFYSSDLKNSDWSGASLTDGRMESSRSGSDPYRSTTTSSQKNITRKSKKPKLFTTVNFAGKVIGDRIATGRFATRVGELIRSRVPISHKEWRRVPDNFKDGVWTALKECIKATGSCKEQQKEQEVSGEGADISEEVDEEPLPELTPEIWESARADVPLGIDPYIWEEFVDMKKNPEKMAKNKVNAVRKSKQTVHYTLGRCTYHNKKHKLDEPGEEVVPPSTTEKWLYRHVRRDGSVHPSAVEAYQVEMAAIAAAALHQRDDENALKLSKIEGELGSLGSAVKEILTCLKRKEPTSSASVGTPSPEKGSNSLLGHPNDDSMDHADSLSNESSSSKVEIQDNKGKFVASGCIAGGDYRHSRKERILYYMKLKFLEWLLGSHAWTVSRKQKLSFPLLNSQSCRVTQMTCNEVLIGSIAEEVLRLEVGSQ
ncbi:hypothetical protein C5167_047084 [Papaver somniferum]|uniref:DUF4216 domain-containing protein n=1 Tax=Papaver somniferum TaxID=3469 RepID=A0A4Y7LII2_PAPSO|nr:hypothetical protein C5167_047084 [Papaver somniferum]